MEGLILFWSLEVWLSQGAFSDSPGPVAVCAFTLTSGIFSSAASQLKYRGVNDSLMEAKDEVHEVIVLTCADGGCIRVACIERALLGERLCYLQG